MRHGDRSAGTAPTERFRQTIPAAIVRGTSDARDAGSRQSDRIRARISTGAVARDGARILQDGWELANFRANPVVLYQHDDGTGGPLGVPTDRMPIATSENEAVEGEGRRARMLATARFDMADEFAVRVLGKIRRGLINATSARWLPLETRVEEETAPDGRRRAVLVFVRQELLEWSFVAIPSDPGASILRADGGALHSGAPRHAAMPLAVSMDRACRLLESHRPTLTAAEVRACRAVYAQVRASLATTRMHLSTSERDEIGRVLNRLTGSMRQALRYVEAQRSTHNSAAAEVERLFRDATMVDVLRPVSRVRHGDPPWTR